MIRLLAAGALLCSVASCAFLPQLAATATSAAVSAETVATLTAICRRGEPAIAIAANPAMPAAVAEIGSFVGAYCGQLLAGSVPPTTDAFTSGWLERNIGTLLALVGR